LSGDITNALEAHARSAGALAANESYRDNAVSGTRLSGGFSPNIPTQYANGRQAGPVKVVIMDGGGNDMLQGACSNPPNSSCPDIQNAVTAADMLMDRMASEGVEHLIYAFYPEPVGNSTLKARLDLLRPLMQQVTATSPIRTSLFLDLRPVFEGRYGQYVLSDGIHPSAAGSQATADAIWTQMRQNCIAQ
jgi:lysophospholipase L1-like esterase